MLQGERITASLKLLQCMSTIIQIVVLHGECVRWDIRRPKKRKVESGS